MFILSCFKDNNIFFIFLIYSFILYEVINEKLEIVFFFFEFFCCVGVKGLIFCSDSLGILI